MRISGLILPALALALAGCGGTESEAPEAAAQRGIDRSVADIRAAEAAMQEPVAVSRSVGELTGKTAAVPKAKGGSAAKAGAAKDAAPADG